MLSFLRHRRGAPDPAELTAALMGFLGERAAFVAQKTILDYCRVKAGRQEAALFADPGFQAALEHCRWQVFFAAAADVTALVEAWLRPYAPGREAALAGALAAAHDRALDAAPPPAAEADAAAASRRALPGHLAGLQLAAPRPANRLPLLATAPLFATLPVHAAQRTGEAPAIRGALRFHIVATQQALEARFAPAQLLDALLRTDAP